MQLDLSEIVIRPGMASEADVDQPAVAGTDLRLAAPIRGRMRFQNSGDLLNVRGQLTADLIIPCDRCLVDVRVPVKMEIEERMPLDEIRSPRPPGEADIDSLVASVVHLDQGRPILNLDELIRQHLELEVPIQTLCQEACLGLCPTCGANLNEGPCACAPERKVSPFAPLAALLERDGEGTQQGGR